MVRVWHCFKFIVTVMAMPRVRARFWDRSSVSVRVIGSVRVRVRVRLYYGFP